MLPMMLLFHLLSLLFPILCHHNVHYQHTIVYIHQDTQYDNSSLNKPYPLLSFSFMFPQSQLFPDLL